jgi:hypothetical protein
MHDIDTATTPEPGTLDTIDTATTPNPPPPAATAPARPKATWRVGLENGNSGPPTVGVTRADHNTTRLQLLFIATGLPPSYVTAVADEEADAAAEEATRERQKALDLARNADLAIARLRDGLAVQEGKAVDMLLNGGEEAAEEAEADLAASRKKISMLSARSEVARTAAADREREANRKRTSARAAALARAVDAAQARRDAALAKLLAESGDTLSELAQAEEARLAAISAIRWRP